jgi:hypothetical protein
MRSLDLDFTVLPFRLLGKFTQPVLGLLKVGLTRVGFPYNDARQAKRSGGE